MAFEKGLVEDDENIAPSIKAGVLEYILQPDKHLTYTRTSTTRYELTTTLRAGDNKEGWDNIDLFGWLGYPMQLKVDFLCRDSILAAPLALDLCLLMDLAARSPSLKHLGIQK